MARKRKSSSRKGNIRALGGKTNKFAMALKMTKGKTCDRKKVLRAVKAGSSPSAAVKRYCR